MLNLVATAYPIVLVIITCILMELHARNCRIIHILWKPFSIILNKTNTIAVTGDAVIQAFASFILLSASTLLYNTVAALKQTHVYQSSDCSLYRAVVFSDPTVTWLSHRHLFYVVVVFVPFVLLFLIPSLLLCLYPHKTLQQVSLEVSECQKQTGHHDICRGSTQMFQGWFERHSRLPITSRRVSFILYCWTSDDFRGHTLDWHRCGRWVRLYHSGVPFGSYQALQISNCQPVTQLPLHGSWNSQHLPIHLEIRYFSPQFPTGAHFHTCPCDISRDCLFMGWVVLIQLGRAQM